MKRFIMLTLTVWMLLAVTVSAAAAETNVVPQKMQPGTILIYDEN